MIHWLIVSLFNSHPDALRIPFHNQLFGNAPFDASSVVPLATATESQYEQVTSTDSVNWSNRGQKRRANDPHECPRIDSNGNGIAVKLKVTAKSLRTQGAQKPTSASSANAQSQNNKSQPSVREKQQQQRRRHVIHNAKEVASESSDDDNEENGHSCEEDNRSQCSNNGENDVIDDDDDYFHDNSVAKGQCILLCLCNVDDCLVDNILDRIRCDCG